MASGGRLGGGENGQRWVQASSVFSVVAFASLLVLLFRGGTRFWPGCGGYLSAWARVGRMDGRTGCKQAKGGGHAGQGIAGLHSRTGQDKAGTGAGEAEAEAGIAQKKRDLGTKNHIPFYHYRYHYRSYHTYIPNTPFLFFFSFLFQTSYSRSHVTNFFMRHTSFILRTHSKKEKEKKRQMK